jgi:hypothetical protein
MGAPHSFSKDMVSRDTDWRRPQPSGFLSMINSIFIFLNMDMQGDCIASGNLEKQLNIHRKQRKT